MNLILTLLLLITSFAARADMASQANQMLSYFGSNCSINSGEWAQGAILSAQNLISTMESLRDDKDCKAAAGSVADIQTLQKFVASLESNTDQKEMMALTRQEQTLLLALGGTTDANELAVIRSELRQNQLKQAQFAGYSEFNNSNFRKSEEAMATLAINTQAFLSTLTANQTCLQNNTSILTTIAQLAGNVAASVLPTYGPLIKAGVELSGQVVEFARVSHINRHIKQTTIPLAATAYQCALETFSNQWCEAQDTANAVRMKQVPPENYEKDALWVGIKILDIDLPSILKWLRKVRAGSTPTTIAEAERQNRSSRREMRVRMADRFGQAAMLERKEDFEISQTAEARWQIVRKVILNILVNVLDDRDPSALFEVYNQFEAPYLLIGLKRDQFPQANGGIKDFAQFNPFGSDWHAPTPYIPSLDKLKINFDAWIAEANTNMQREILQVLQVSPLDAMDDAINDEGKYPTTPRKAIKVIVKFMQENMPTTFTTENHRKIYADTIEILTKIGALIDRVHDPVYMDLPGISPLEALTEISRLAQLNFGTALIDGRVTRSIRYTLNDIVIKRAQNPEDTTSQFLAADDIVKSIERVTPVSSVTATLDNVQAISQNSASSFVSLFGKTIRKSLEYYDLKAQHAQENNNPEAQMQNLRMKARLCMRLYTVDLWPKKVPFELCKGVQLKHANSKGPKSIVLTEAELTKPFHERVCEVRNFMRRSDIFDRYINRVSRSKKPSTVTR